MASKRTNSETIDLSDPTTLTNEEIAERKDELYRIEMKLAALTVRQQELMSELGVGLTGSALFLDEAADIFRDAPEPAASKHPMSELEIDDSEFNDRFATFVSSDAEGDHKARRWLGAA